MVDGCALVPPLLQPGKAQVSVDGVEIRVGWNDIDVVRLNSVV
jgi:hypothetical protein